jgi:uncharacterized protein YcbX
MSFRSQLLATREMPLYRSSIEALPQDITGMQTSIQSLRIHPIKSLGMPLYLPKARLTRFGLATSDGNFMDRQALLGRRQHKESKPHVTHRLFSQRNFGPLSRCMVTYDDFRLMYRDPEKKMPPLLLEKSCLAPHDCDTTIVEMHQKEYPCIVEGENGRITQWVRQFLRLQGCYEDIVQQIDILLQPRDFKRTVADHHRRDEEGGILYADGGQLLLGNRQTLDWMNKELEQSQKRTTRMAAFRPNIEIDLPPNAEDLIDEMMIHTAKGRDVTMLSGLLSVRCTMIDLDPKTGETPDTAINDWLRVNRPHRPTDPKGSKETTFGLNMVVPSRYDGTIIRVGDTCTIMKEKQ